jgi:glucosylglycerol-phosphate synthase
MNLVCKEFVASRVDGDGVLVLSEFAGAAVALGASVIANPFSHKSLDWTILQAIDMPESERRARMEVLRKAVAADTVRNWKPGTLRLPTKASLNTAA